MPTPAIIDLPWKPDEPCPCGERKLFRHCCLHPDGSIRKAVPSLTPPPPPTGHSQSGCYLSTSHNCSHDLSAEHYFSKSVLKIIEEAAVFIGGVPWLPVGTQRQVGIASMT